MGFVITILKCRVIVYMGFSLLSCTPHEAKKYQVAFNQSDTSSLLLTPLGLQTPQKSGLRVGSGGFQELAGPVGSGKEIVRTPTGRNGSAQDIF